MAPRQVTVWRCMRRAGALLAALLISSNAGAEPAATPQRQPVERFASLPLLSQVRLSPDGRQITALMNIENDTGLITRTVLDGKVRSILKTDNRKFHFNWVRWANNERLLVSLRFASRREFVGTVETRLLSLKADGSGLIDLVRSTPVSGSMNRATETQQIQDRVIDWLPHDGKHVLLELSEPDRFEPGVYKVDIETGQRTLVKAPERNVA